MFAHQPSHFSTSNPDIPSSPGAHPISNALRPWRIVYAMTCEVETDTNASLSIEEPPRTLYKYLPPERIDILQKMELRFSSPFEFNDIFDSHYLSPRRQGREGKAARRRLRKQLGVLCLTERPNDHLMWVHYARNHTGFVLGFPAHAPFFTKDNRCLRKVVYQEKPQVLSEADVDICFHKSDEWKYEREWRCVRSFQHSESRFVPIDVGLITQIIFGSRMETWQIARIMRYTRADARISPQFLLSSPLSTSWAFQNLQKRMSLCRHCEGNGYLMKEA